MQNKTVNYIKYAIGEIILVVLGILIALQINNWNENRKNISLQINVLKDIQNDIKENIKNLETGIDELNIAKADMLEVIELYEQKTPYHDTVLASFSKFINFWDPDFTYAGFENLKSQGVNLISNEQLRKKIINLVEVDMQILDQADMSRLDQIGVTMTFPLIKKYFHRNLRTESGYMPYLPSNYDAMMKDLEFYNFCTEMAYRQIRSSSRYGKFNEAAKSLISEIEVEIKNLKS